MREQTGLHALSTQGLSTVEARSNERSQERHGRSEEAGGTVSKLVPRDSQRFFLFVDRFLNNFMHISCLRCESRARSFPDHP